jgi:ABC-type transporter Mla subunit MlaD
VIERANPALKNVDKLIRILAQQNKQLERLAVDSDTIMRPLAEQRRHVAGGDRAHEHGGGRDGLAARRPRGQPAALPRGAGQLKPTMARLGTLADQMTPVFSDLGPAAPDINRLISGLGPFSAAGIPAVKSLGEASKIGTPAITNARPILSDINTLSKYALRSARRCAS